MKESENGCHRILPLKHLHACYAVFCDEIGNLPVCPSFCSKALPKVLPSVKNYKGRPAKVLYIGLHGLGVSCDTNSQPANDNEI